MAEELLSHLMLEIGDGDPLPGVIPTASGTRARMMEQASQMQQKMMKQLEEQMADMPEAEREQMKAMMAQMG